MAENTKLCELDDIGKKDFLNKVKEHKLKFKPQIGLSKNMRFGIEIEMLGDDFQDFAVLRRDAGDLWCAERFFSEREIFYPYDCTKWILDEDETLPVLNGRELKSPVLYDTKEDWYSLEKMLKWLKTLVKNVRVDERCAFQVHFDAGVFEKNPDALFPFMILLAETEPVLTRFFNGEFINLRRGADLWAKPFSLLLMDAMPINYGSYEILLSEIYTSDKQFKRYAFDFSRLYKNACMRNRSDKNTIENRIPNGTLEPIIIQNNIMLFGMLMEHVLNGKYDSDKGIRNIDEFNRDESLIDERLAFYVADMLPNDEYKLDFLKQYYKDGSTYEGRQLKKSLDFF